MPPKWWVRLIFANAPSQLVVGRLLASALALLSAPIVARSIGPEGLGQAAAGIALFVLVPVVLGIGVPLEVRRRASIQEASSIVRAARLICIGALGPAVIVAAISNATVFANFDDLAKVASFVGIAAAPTVISWSCDVSVLIAQRRYRSVLLLQVLAPLTYLTSISIFWAGGAASVGTVLLSYIAGMLANFALGLLLVKVSPRGARDAIRPVLKAGVRFAGSAIAEAASHRLDQVLVLPLIGALQSGLYAVAAAIGSLPLALGHAVAAAYFTPVARAEKGDRAEIKSEAVRSGLAVALMSIPPLTAVVPVAIVILFGPDYAAAVPVAWIALLGSMAMIANFVCSSVLAAEGRGLWMTMSQMISLTLGVALLYFLAPSLGAVGAATASSLSYWALFVLLVSGLAIPIRKILPRPQDFATVIRLLLRAR